MTQFYSRNDVNYSGDVYSIPFDYIDKKEVKVYIDDELWTKWHFLNKHQLTLDEVPEDIRYSNIISVRRETDIEEKVVDYNNNSLLNKENLNKSQDQLLYAVQEIYDNNTQFAIDIRAEVDEKVERVSDAVEKLEFLEDSVAIANEAALEATEQAQIATEKAEEITQLVQQATEDISQQAANEKAEIDELSEDLKESIKDIKVLTTLEIGDIGIAPLGIDETKGKRRYLNGQLIIQEQYIEFTNKVKSAIALYPTLACTEEEWQTNITMSALSQCGKFVIDDEAGTIRLPKIIMPIQGLTDLSKLAEIVEAGLPNIKGQFNTWNDTIKATGDGFGFLASIGGNTGWKNALNNTSMPLEQLYLDASRCSSIYGNSNTVQQEQIQYPYFIQVATGAETEDNIINEIELNNPFSLLDYKFSEYELNNLSWLRSNGQFNSKAIYPAVYNLLLKIYNGTETKAGVSVKLSTGSYTDTDFVLNTAEETFRLPVKVKLASGNAVVGNGMALGLTDGSTNYGLRLGGSDAYTQVSLGQYTAGYGREVGVTGLGNGNTTSAKTAGITTDPTKSGIETSSSGLKLYFYVGETVQNANLINAGRIEEKIADFIPDNKTIWDGQWVGKYRELSTAHIAGTYTIDLSDYLPNDGYVYEILLGSHMYGSSNPSWSTINSSLMGADIRVCMCNSGQWSCNAVAIPIATDRKLTYYIVSSAHSDTRLWAFCYRRVGTNQ